MLPANVPSSPPKRSTTIGATAPETRIVSASAATRQVIIRVRSPFASCSPAASVMSAGIATYGTWKKAKAVAVATNATQTHAAPAPPVKTPAKIDANSTLRLSPPKSRYGRRAPQRPVVRSDSRPAIGFTTTSHALGSKYQQPGQSRRDAERVRQVRQQQQAGHGAERAGDQRSGGVTQPNPAR